MSAWEAALHPPGLGWTLTIIIIFLNVTICLLRLHPNILFLPSSWTPIKTHTEQLNLFPVDLK